MACGAILPEEPIFVTFSFMGTNLVSLVAGFSGVSVFGPPLPGSPFCASPFYFFDIVGTFAPLSSDPGSVP